MIHILGLQLAHRIFAAAEQFSVNLQAKDITIQEATRGARLLVSHFKSLRTEPQFNTFYEQTLVQSLTLTEEPKLPRYRKMPKRLDEGDSPHRYLNPKDKFRHDYFEALELAAGEVERRLDQSDFSMITGIEKLIVNAANGTIPKDIPDSVSKYLEGDVDAECLKIQLLMLTDMIKTTYADTVKKVTNVRTVANAMEQG